MSASVPIVGVWMVLFRVLTPPHRVAYACTSFVLSKPIKMRFGLLRLSIAYWVRRLWSPGVRTIYAPLESPFFLATKMLAPSGNAALG